MPSQSKKWDAIAERDLCVAIITTSKERSAKYDWPEVHALMTTLGYDFTRDAISQHHTKVIMKDFKNRHGNKSLTGGSVSSTPKKAMGAPETPISKKRSASKAAEEAVDDDDEDDEDLKFGSAQKKLKYEASDDNTLVVKSEPPHFRRERSSTVMGCERGFHLWADRHDQE